MYNNLADLLAAHNGTFNPVYLFGNDEEEIRCFIKDYLAHIDGDLIKVKTFYDFLKEIENKKENIEKISLEKTEVFLLGGVCEIKEEGIKESLHTLINRCILEKKQMILISEDGFDICDIKTDKSIVLSFNK